MRNLVIYLKSFKDSIVSLIYHDGFEMAGYLAFLAFIAIFPCTIFIGKIASFLNYFFAEKLGEDIIVQFLTSSFNSMIDLPISTFCEAAICRLASYSTFS